MKSTVATSPAAMGGGRTGHARCDDPGLTRVLEASVTGILSRRPAVGLAIGLVRDGQSAFCARGLADVATSTPVTTDTVFRIGSITKTLTAVAIMQLVERGLVDLDGPANAYLRSFKLVNGEFGSPTLRHLLTHTGGIPDMRRVADLLHAGLTPDDGRPPLLSVPFGRRLPSLADYYGGGLQVVSEPGRFFAYSNHGFGALGQIVEDVSGVPLDRYLREQVFEPLEMVDTDLVRSDRLAARLATGYAFGHRGVRPVPDRDWIGAGAGGVYSTTRDLARYAAALLGGGTNQDGSILEPSTLGTMFEPQYEPDPRLRGMGLGFFRGQIGGHRVVSHDGILPGFHSRLVVAPDDSMAVIGLTNGSAGAFTWLPIELDSLLGQMLGVRADLPRDEIPHHPEVWQQVCGRYVLPSRIADLRERLLFGCGVEVLVRGGRLVVRILTPIPALWRGMPLEPDDANDPYAFRLDLSRHGLEALRIVFVRGADGLATAAYADLGGQPWCFVKAAGVGLPSSGTAIAGALAVGGVVAAVRRRRPR